MPLPLAHPRRHTPVKEEPRWLVYVPRPSGRPHAQLPQYVPSANGCVEEDATLDGEGGALGSTLAESAGRSARMVPDAAEEEKSGVGAGASQSGAAAKPGVISDADAEIMVLSAASKDA